MHLKKKIETETLKGCAIWKIGNDGIENTYLVEEEKPAQRAT